MDATGDYQMKWNTERERKISSDITYMWNLKYDTNEHVYKAETDSQTTEQACGSWGRGEQKRDKLGIWGE